MNTKKEMQCMKKNKKGLLMLLLLLVMQTFVGCGKIEYMVGLNYKWSVSALNAPIGFPIRGWGSIDYGYGNSATIRRRGISHHGWGKRNGLTTSEHFGVPQTLNVFWYSFVEEQFYQGSFELDQEKIKRIFEEEHFSFDEDPRYEFFVSVCPGGGVGIWITGIGVEVYELDYFQTEKTTANWRDFVGPSAIDDKQKLIETMRNDVPKDSIVKYQKEGFPTERWKKYRNRYKWKVRMPLEYRVDVIQSEMYNGEFRKLKIEKEGYDINKISSYKSIPKIIELLWREKSGNIYMVNLLIPSEEYDKIANFFKEHDDEAVFYVEPYIPKNVRKIRLFLESKEERMEIVLDDNEVFASRNNKK